MSNWGPSFKQIHSLEKENAKRVILHIDFDSYFASCEQQFNPTLRGKPIGVTAANSRSCIIAASREAKKLGLKVPSNIWEASAKIPEFRSVPAHFKEYWEISKKFINITKDYTPFVEVFSLDEVFMDVTATIHLYGGIYPLIHRIRQRLVEQVGEYITVSVGISHNKLLAKLASGIQKPCGTVEINDENMEALYYNADLIDICGIGNRILKRLHLLGVFTLRDLRNVPLRYLLDEFGTVEGHFLKNVGHGIDHSAVLPYYADTPVKSVGRNYCLPKNEHDERVVLQNIYELSEELGIKLRRIKRKARRVGVFLQGNKNFSGQKLFSNYFDTGQDIFNAFLTLLNGNTSYTLSYLHKKDYVRQISIWVSHLEDSTNIPRLLFERDKKREKIYKTIDVINEKFGDHTLRNGFLLYAQKLTTVPNGFMADKYERMILQQEGLTIEPEGYTSSH